MKGRFFFLFVFICSYCAPNLVFAVDDSPGLLTEITYPSHLSEITESRPTVTWTHAPEAHSYTLTLITVLEDDNQVEKFYDI